MHCVAVVFALFGGMKEQVRPPGRVKVNIGRVDALDHTTCESCQISAVYGPTVI